MNTTPDVLYLKCSNVFLSKLESIPTDEIDPITNKPFCTILPAKVLGYTIIEVDGRGYGYKPTMYEPDSFVNIAYFPTCCQAWRAYVRQTPRSLRHKVYRPAIHNGQAV